MAYETLADEHIATTPPCFQGAEGVAVDRDGNVWGGGRDGVVRKLARDGTVHEVARIEGFPCGIAFDREGALFVCDGARGGVWRVGATGEVSCFAEEAEGLRLAAPNFPVFDKSGNLYVSISTDFPLVDSDRFAAEIAQPAPKGAVVRLWPDGSGDVVARGLYFPNGLAIDPTEEALYVLESTRQRCVRIALGRDGGLGAPEPYGPPLGGLCDGMAFDADGDLIVTLPMENRLVVIERSGALSVLCQGDGERIAMPSNCAFGGPALDELYVTSLSGNHMARLALGRPGHPLYHQRAANRLEGGTS